MIKLDIVKQDRDHFVVTFTEPGRIEVSLLQERVIAYVYEGTKADQVQKPIGCYDGPRGENTSWKWEHKQAVPEGHMATLAYRGWQVVKETGWMDGMLARSPGHHDPTGPQWDKESFRCRLSGGEVIIGQLGNGTPQHNTYDPEERPWGVVPDLTDIPTQSVLLEWLRREAESDILHMAWYKDQWHIQGIPLPNGNMVNTSGTTRDKCIFNAIMYWVSAK